MTSRHFASLALFLACVLSGCGFAPTTASVQHVTAANPATAAVISSNGASFATSHAAR